MWCPTKSEKCGMGLVMQCWLNLSYLVEKNSEVVINADNNCSVIITGHST